MGHMNVMWYAGKFDEASWQLLSTYGLTPSRMRRERIVMAAVEGHIVYKQELRAGDVISVHSEIIDVGNKSVRMAHEMRNDDTGESVASMIIVGVHVDAVSRKATALPADVRERMDDADVQRRAATVMTCSGSATNPAVMSAKATA
jgi:acyl-CoA thioester hydrolase